MRREELFRRIEGIETERRAADVALIRLAALSAAEPSVLREASLEAAHVSTALDNLESTYVVRLYAEFEAGLRDYWTAPRGMRRKTDPPAQALIDGIGTRRQVDPDTLLNTHAVRDYRNELVHAGDPAVTLALQICRSFLSHFISYLPLEW